MENKSNNQAQPQQAVAAQQPAAVSASSELADLKLQVAQNAEMLEEIEGRLKRMQYLQVAKFMVTVLLVVIPILGAWFILPRLLDGMLQQYGISDIGEGVNPLEVLEQVEALQEGLDTTQ